MDRHRKVWTGAAALLATGALLAGASSAHAQRAPSVGPGTPWGQTGIQLYDFSSYLSNGAGEITCPVAARTRSRAAPRTTASARRRRRRPPARLERVFAWAQKKDIRNIELYGYPGNPFPTATAGSTGDLAGLAALKAMGDKYGIRFPAATATCCRRPTGTTRSGPRGSRPDPPR